METKSNFLVGVIIFAVALAAVALGMSLNSPTPVSYLQAQVTSPGKGTARTGNIALANECNSKIHGSGAQLAKADSLAATVDDATLNCVELAGGSGTGGPCLIGEDGCSNTFSDPGVDPDNDPVIADLDLVDLDTYLPNGGKIKITRGGQVVATPGPGGPIDQRYLCAKNVAVECAARFPGEGCTLSQSCIKTELQRQCDQTVHINSCSGGGAGGVCTGIGDLACQLIRCDIDETFTCINGSSFCVKTSACEGGGGQCAPGDQYCDSVNSDGICPCEDFCGDVDCKGGGGGGQCVPATECTATTLCPTKEAPCLSASGCVPICSN